MGYDYETQYFSGYENTAADAPFRRPDSLIVNNLFMPQVSIWEEIKIAVHDDEFMMRIKSMV